MAYHFSPGIINFRLWTFVVDAIVSLMMYYKIKKLFKEGSSDYAKGLVDPKEFHKIFHFFARAFYLLDDEQIPKWMKYIHGLLVINGILADIVCSFGLYNAIRSLDIVLFAEWGAYTMIFTYQLLILTCPVLNKPCYRNLVKHMKEDFNYICTTGQRYRARYFEEQILTRKICIISLFFTTAVGGSMVLFTVGLLVVFLIMRDPAGNEERPLLFPLWMFDVDFHKTPYFEIFFTYTDLCILEFAFVYGFALQTGVLWVRQMSAKVDLIIYGLEDLCEGITLAKSPKRIMRNNRVLKSRLREIIRRHQSLNCMLQDFAGVYKKLLMMEQKIVAGLVCLTAYGSAEKLAMGEVHFVLNLLCVATAVVVFIPCYLCTFIRIKIRSISDACFDVPFWETGPVVRPYLVLLMQRSLRPLPLQAPGFEEISLQTFSNKMTSAYSMFNMLRQTNIGGISNQ